MRDANKAPIGWSSWLIGSACNIDIALDRSPLKESSAKKRALRIIPTGPFCPTLRFSSGEPITPALHADVQSPLATSLALLGSHREQSQQLALLAGRRRFAQWSKQFESCRRESVGNDGR